MIRRKRSTHGHLPSLEAGTSEPLLSRVPASVPTDEQQHVLFTKFQASSEAQCRRPIFSESQYVFGPDWHTIDMSQPILRLS